MREFDINGMHLADYQGGLFAKSVTELNYSTPIFIRRFLHSSLLKRLDKQKAFLIDPEPLIGLEEINLEFGETSFGHTKFDEKAMYWVGWFTRYLSYTREISTNIVFKYFPYEKLISLYPTFHTQGEEWCFESLMDLYHLPYDYFDKNNRLKEAIRKNNPYFAKKK